MQMYLNHWILQTAMLVLVIYALFADDLKMAAFPKSADDAFNALTLIVLIAFSVEIILNIISQENYLFSFYFWLDAVATLTLLTDITWIWDGIVG